MVTSTVVIGVMLLHCLSLCLSILSWDCSLFGCHVVTRIALELMIVFVTAIVLVVSSYGLDLGLWAVVDSPPPLWGGGCGGGRALSSLVLGSTTPRWGGG